ncbi:MAG: hypothetical protein ABGX90_08825 [Brachybacterium sp.]|uniref:hypothetical protein n=1 Tax=Brachybacterium TaxID=43668 RepID=UPI00293AB7DF|nr:hypothetical protein [Brachybacterium paraconglomeratum]
MTITEPGTPRRGNPVGIASLAFGILLLLAAPPRSRSRRTVCFPACWMMRFGMGRSERTPPGE